MTTLLTNIKPRPIVYPCSDGEPMAENTIQYKAIVTIKENLELLFEKDPQVFIAADLFWYPEEGNNKLRVAPDTMLAFGVEKGDRLSYLQWNEKGIAPQVVFEVLSPSNTKLVMANKLQFYGDHSVEEYYIYDPDDGTWLGYTRQDGQLRVIPEMHQWVSPRMSIRFESAEGLPLSLFFPNGERFLSPLESALRRREAEELVTLEKLAREQATRRADAEAQRANTEAHRANAAEERAARLAGLLQAAGIDPDGAAANE